MEKQCHNEIVELHAFFQVWFNGKLEKNEETFNRFPGAVGDKFTLITPSGQKHRRNDIIRLVWDAHASRKNTDTAMKIWIENFEFKELSKDIFLVTYEEWQKIDAENKGRLSTAIFQKCENEFNGIKWLHVHETWLNKK